MITAGFNPNDSNSSSCEGSNNEDDYKSAVNSKKVKMGISDKITQYYSNKVMQEQQI
jgi:hypothetical protein